MKIDEVFNILIKYYEEIYDESPFKSIILDIKSILPEKRYKKIKGILKYAEEMKELSFLQIENGKNNLIKIKNDLIKTFKKINRNKKKDINYYKYEENKYYRLKDVRNLFNQNDDNDDIYEGIEYLFSENNFEYDEIKEYIDSIHEIIKQEVVKQEYIEEVDFIEIKQTMGREKKNKQCLIDYEYIAVEEKKVECYKVEGIIIKKMKNLVKVDLNMKKLKDY